MPGCVAPTRPNDSGYYAGAPTKYMPEMDAIAEAVLTSGDTLADLAADLGIARDTLNDWRKKYLTFSAAVARGLRQSERWWRREGKAALKDGRYNTNMYKFQMANRFGWSEKVETKTTVTHEIGEDTAALLADLRGERVKVEQLQDVTPTVLESKTDPESQS